MSEFEIALQTGRGHINGAMNKKATKLSQASGDLIVFSSVNHQQHSSLPE